MSLVIGRNMDQRWPTVNKFEIADMARINVEERIQRLKEMERLD